jgi:hypothetical protein
MSGVVIKIFPREGVWFFVDFEKQDVRMRIGCAVICSL